MNERIAYRIVWLIGSAISVLVLAYSCNIWIDDWRFWAITIAEAFVSAASWGLGKTEWGDSE